jgi:hypothetical protein
LMPSVLGRDDSNEVRRDEEAVREVLELVERLSGKPPNAAGSRSGRGRAAEGARMEIRWNAAQRQGGLGKRAWHIRECGPGAIRTVWCASLDPKHTEAWRPGRA